MSFDKTPAQSTYQTKVLSLVKEMNNRGSDTSKDEDYLNIFPEIIKNKNTKEDAIKLVKRDGCTSFISLSGTARGIHYWKDESKLFVAISDDVYVYNVLTGALIATLNTVFATTTSGAVGFCEFLYDTGDVKIVVTDGTTLSTIDSSNTVVAGADADMPVHIPVPIFLDGYLFIVKTSTADIYNSNLNNPLLYTPGDFLTAEMRPDELSHIAVLNNYIVAFGNTSIEYFWDAAIATGSPLQRNDTPIKLTGYIGAPAQHGNRLFFVGENENSQPDVFMLEDFKMRSVGSEAIRRHLASLLSTSSSATSGIHGNIASMGGHDFYVLHSGLGTYVLEIESGVWHRWAFKQQSTFPANFIVTLNTASSALPASKCIFILQNDNTVYRFVPTLYQDNGTNFTCTLVTDKFKFDTYRYKFMNKLVVWASRPSSSASMSIEWSDDDYTTYTTARTVDLNDERPTLTRLGKFRERAFRITFTANQPLLLQSLEVDINLGQT